MQTNFSVRKAFSSDAEWIAPLCHQQFQVAHLQGLSPEDMKYYVDKTFTSPLIEKDMSDTANQYLVAEFLNEPVGCVKVGKAELDLCKNIADACELTRFYLLPEKIGKGAGSALMGAFVEEAQARHCSSIWLHVYSKNLKAISFYEKWGFIKMGQQDFPVRNSCPVGWVMQKII
ncbi:MAG: GNAT family N-acetyltransferase [Bacteroidetes bacterium]|nr:GNAT family N-acetyltransferase [Bacteroidota bacterium]